MANQKHVRIITEEPNGWNAWRRRNPQTRPDLRGADLRGVTIFWADFRGADLSEADARGAYLGDANLRGAVLTGADLRETSLTEADLFAANLSEADLSDSNLSGADLSQVSFSGANLRKADLRWADLSDAILTEADLSQAKIGRTTFANNDLSTVKGLDAITHLGPSTIGVDTLFRSDGKIPAVFLRGAGVPEDFITFVPSLVGRAVEFYSCFISYSHQDEEFSRRLQSRMRSENLRVWYAPEDMKGGRKLHEEIYSAIQIYDKLLLILSANSMESEWVRTEIRRARKVEREEDRRKLFPIRLVDFEAIEKWECFDADSGRDLAAELREYYIPDFSNWKDHSAFETEFAKLLRDLKAPEG